MTNNEFYYLLLVLAAFGTFGLALAIAHRRYKKLRDQLVLPARQEVPSTPAKVPHRTPAPVS